MRFGQRYSAPAGEPTKTLEYCLIEEIGTQLRIRFKPREGWGNKWYHIYQNAIKQTQLNVLEGEEATVIITPPYGDTKLSILVLNVGNQSDPSYDAHLVARSYEETAPRTTIEANFTPEIMCSTPISRTLALAGLAISLDDCTYMLRPSIAPEGERHFLCRGRLWSDVCPLTAGSMATTGEITGGSQSISVAGTVESFSVIWNNTGLPVVAFSIGFNRSLTAGERTALSSSTFWAAILPAAINTADCTALYPWLAPMYQSLVGWWDASAITGLANNDPVTTWNDRSGLGNHLTQSTANLKPVYKTNQQNGLPAIDTELDLMECNAVGAHFSGLNKPASVVAAAKQDSTKGSHVHLQAYKFGGTGWFVLYGNSSNKLWNYKISDTGSPVTTNSAISVGSTSKVVQFVIPGDRVSSWVNSTIAVNNVAFSVGETTLDRFCFADDATRLGSFWAAALHFETLLYKAALSDVDRIAIRTYQAAKWGITV